MPAHVLADLSLASMFVAKNSLVLLLFMLDLLYRKSLAFIEAGLFAV